MQKTLQVKYLCKSKRLLFQFYAMIANELGTNRVKYEISFNLNVYCLFDYLTVSLLSLIYHKPDEIIANRPQN